MASLLYRLGFLIGVCIVFCASSFQQVEARPHNDAITNFLTEGQDITVYNQNKALIKQKCSFDLKQGVNHIDWDNIATSIDIHSVSLNSADSKAIEVSEQSFQSDLLSHRALLGRYIGKTIHFINDGKSEEQAGVVLGSMSNPDDYAIQTGDHYILNPPGLLNQSTLSFIVKTNEGGERNLLLTYEASNVNWQCDYNLLLNNDQNKCDLRGWVTLTNQCGLNFKNSNLKLIAGSVQAIARPMQYSRGALRAAALAYTDSAAPVEGSFADYHLYTFPEKVSINNNETKRLILIERKAIPVSKKYLFDQHYFAQMPPKSKMPVQVMLEFQNDKKAKQPFPMGDARVYQTDADNDLQLIGEDRIMHTSIGEKIKIKLGEAFDVVGERIHVNSELIDSHHRKDNYKVVFNNHLDKDIVVTDIEHVPDLATFQSNLYFDKIDSNTFQFEAKVPANDNAELSYTIESAF